jgi:hypothetical protein
MPKESLKNKIFSYLVRYSARWVHGGDIEKLAFEAGYMASNAGRRCREMVQSGVIEHRYNERGEVEYRYISQEPHQEPRPRVQPRLMPLSQKFQ